MAHARVRLLGKDRRPEKECGGVERGGGRVGTIMGRTLSRSWEGEAEVERAFFSRTVMRWWCCGRSECQIA